MRTLMAAVLAAFFVFPALAQTCAPRAAILQVAHKNYQEVPVNRGLASSGRMIEVLASPRGTFTLVVISPEGIACIVGDGEAWQAVEPKQPESQ